MMAADRVIRWTTAGAVLDVAGVAAVASYEHAYALVRAHGEAGWTGRLVPLTVDGLIYASSMVMLDSARRLAGPGPPLSVAHLVREPVCRTPETRPVIFSRRRQSRRTCPDQLHLCGRHCLPATAPKHALGGYVRAAAS